MKNAFIKNFKGTCTRPATIEDMRRCVQKEDDDSEDRKDGKGKNHSCNRVCRQGGNGNKRKGEAGSELVAHASGAEHRDFKSRRGNNNNGNAARKKLSSVEIFDGPYISHIKDGRVAAHSTKDCFQFKEVATLKKGDKGADKDNESGHGKTAGVLHAFHSTSNMGGDKNANDDESGFSMMVVVLYTFHGTTNKMDGGCSPAR
jgi:hypothetical protein